MAYLSEVQINPLRSGAQRLLASPQRIHAAVEGSVPPTRDGRVLWRLESRPRETRLLIQTPEHPTLDHIVEQAGWVDSPSGRPRTADLQPLLAQLGSGREFSFKVMVNPVRAMTHVEKPSKGQTERLENRKSVRVAERTAAFQLDWFLRRAMDSDQWGFRVLGDRIQPQCSLTERGRLHFRHDGFTTVTTATFEGNLVVTRPGAMREALLGGLGKAKAYGCGLLTLAPAGMRDVVEG